MATSNNLGDLLTSIANKLRSSKGVSVPINAQHLSNEIINFCSDYSNRKDTLDASGLSEIGWTKDDIEKFKYNVLHYQWEDSAGWFTVTVDNKALYGVVKDLDSVKYYKTRGSFEFCPMFDSSAITDATDMFNGAIYMRGLPKLNTSNVTNAKNMFAWCLALRAVPDIDFSNVENAENMFYSCRSLETVSPKIDFSKVTNGTTMFYGCKSLGSLKANFNSLITGKGMFQGSSIRTCDISCENLTEMYNMFSESGIREIKHIDTSKVAGLYSAFYRCSKLKSINLDCSSATHIIKSFLDCPSLETAELKNLDKCKSAEYAFTRCASLKRVGKLKTHNCENFYNTFNTCTALEEVEEIDFSSVTNNNYLSNSTFYNCGNLKRLILADNSSLNTNFGVNHTTKLDYDSIKSILIAASKKTHNSETTLSFADGMSIKDRDGELLELKTTCMLKNWTINNLTIIP